VTINRGIIDNTPSGSATRINRFRRGRDVVLVFQNPDGSIFTKIQPRKRNRLRKLRRAIRLNTGNKAAKYQTLLNELEASNEP